MPSHDPKPRRKAPTKTGKRWPRCSDASWVVGRSIGGHSRHGPPPCQEYSFAIPGPARTRSAWLSASCPPPAPGDPLPHLEPLRVDDLPGRVPPEPPCSRRGPTSTRVLRGGLAGVARRQETKHVREGRHGLGPEARVTQPLGERVRLGNPCAPSGAIVVNAGLDAVDLLDGVRRGVRGTGHDVPDVRVVPVEPGLEPGHQSADETSFPCEVVPRLHRASEAQGRGGRADPAASRPRPGQVVVLGPPPDGLEVVALPAGPQLAHAEHPQGQGPSAASGPPAPEGACVWISSSDVRMSAAGPCGHGRNQRSRVLAAHAIAGCGGAIRARAAL